ncbi:MAG TPA: DUF3187 family protein [Thermoanaerobaculia bacterium]|nr:DUF3187 family protein [Thermoanaerobaculia bacterium]HUM30732.1 DUF3187 family protein [Thermoanaerobaculia bacterium]HXK68979.1 DUF3187 family protein [Thermoanaerobaculia bacterium]
MKCCTFKGVAHAKAHDIFCLILTILAFFTPFLPGQDGSEYRDPVPMRIRDMMPFSILSMAFMPSPGPLPPKGDWGFEIHLSHANTFIMSKNVKEYLGERNDRQRLTQNDIAAIRTEGEGDIFYFDGEMGLLTVSAHYGLGERIQAFTHVPIYYFWGGYLDGFIEGFHNVLGIGQAGRDYVKRDEAQLYLSLGSNEFSFLNPSPTGGVGDPTFGMRYSLFPSRSRSQLTLETATKVPIADPDAYRSTGHSDYGIQLAFQTGDVTNKFYADISHVWTGNLAFMPGFKVDNILSVTLAYGRKLSDSIYLIGQVTRSTSIFSEETDSELGDTELQISTGVRIQKGTFLYQLAFTENLANFNNTPDIGFHLGICFLLPRGKARHPRIRTDLNSAQNHTLTNQAKLSNKF